MDQEKIQYGVTSLHLDQTLSSSRRKAQQCKSSHFNTEWYKLNQYNTSRYILKQGGATQINTTRYRTFCTTPIRNAAK